MSTQQNHNPDRFVIWTEDEPLEWTDDELDEFEDRIDRDRSPHQPTEVSDEEQAGILCKPSDFTAPKRERVRGIMI